ncbi:MAG: hypothetical protein WDN69_14145 [Aliidongia sp.]
MKIARSREELAENARLARARLSGYFGDGRIYAERLVERPRHIEVQVLGDGTGKVLHLHERECSIQRRYQKLVEEAPAADLAPALRDEICGAASARCRCTIQECRHDRVRAGTRWYVLFPEMNTRLQVEHR